MIPIQAPELSLQLGKALNILGSPVLEGLDPAISPVFIVGALSDTSSKRRQGMDSAIVTVGGAGTFGRVSYTNPLTGTNPLVGRVRIFPKLWQSNTANISVRIARGLFAATPGANNTFLMFPYVAPSVLIVDVDNTQVVDVGQRVALSFSAAAILPFPDFYLDPGDQISFQSENAVTAFNINFWWEEEPRP